MAIQLKNLSLASFELFPTSIGQTTSAILNVVEEVLATVVLNKLEPYITKIDKTLLSYIKAYESILKKIGGFDLLYDAYTSSTNQCRNLSPDLIHDPHISGYFYFIISLPSCLRDYVPKETNKFVGFLATDVGNSTSQIETSHLLGVGKKVNSVPVSRTSDNSLNATYYDVYNLAVTQFFHRWQDCIVEPRYGFHVYKHIGDFKSNAIVIHQNNTDKILIDIYLGLYPTSVPTLEQSKSNIALTQKTITFSYDKVIPSQHS